MVQNSKGAPLATRSNLGVLSGGWRDLVGLFDNLESLKRTKGGGSRSSDLPNHF
jgi:hypothetical protein